MRKDSVVGGVAILTWCFLGLAAPAAAREGAHRLSPRQHVALGDERLEQGNYLGAAFQYERALEVDSTYVEAYYKLGRAYTQAGLTYRDYFLRAQEVYDKLGPLVGLENAEYRKHYAKLLLAQWAVDDAITIYEELVTESPDNCEYWALLGDAERARGLAIQEAEGLEASALQLDEAEKTFRRAMEICPDQFEPVHGLARVLDTRKQFQEVVDLYREYHEKYPKSVEILRGYAIATFNARDWETAANALGELVERDPTPEERLIYIAALRKVDRIDEAEKQGEIYHQTAPKLHGPVQLLPVDVLREKLAIREASERAVALIEKGRCDEAADVWRNSRVQTEAFLEDAEFGSAAEELIVWLDRRILFAEGKCK